MKRDVSDPVTRSMAVTYGLVPGWVVLSLAIAILLIVGDVPRQYQYGPLVASVILLGLPHGAVDHLLLPRQRDEQLSMQWLATVAGIYLVLGGLYALVWFAWPAAAFVLFIVLTWFHWGQGDLYPLQELVHSGAPGSSLQRLLTILTRGGAPMLLPLVAFPGEYEAVMRTIVSVFDAGTAAALDPMFGTRVRVAIAIGYGLALCLTAAVGYLQANELRPGLIDIGELGLLVAFFVLVPPILAIGLYFCFWHSPRHILRTVLLHERSARSLADGRLRPVIYRFVADAAPLSIGAIVLLGGLYLIVPRTPSELPELVGLYLVLIAVLTVPHVGIVTWLDMEQELF